jgi:hypothetical protein
MAEIVAINEPVLLEQRALLSVIMVLVPSVFKECL